MKTTQAPNARRHIYVSKTHVQVRLTRTVNKKKMEHSRSFSFKILGKRKAMEMATQYRDELVAQHPIVPRKKDYDISAPIPIPARMKVKIQPKEHPGPFAKSVYDFTTRQQMKGVPIQHARKQLRKMLPGIYGS